MLPKCLLLNVEAFALLFTDVIGKHGEDEVTICMEDQLRSIGIISSDYDLSPSSILDPKILKGISVDASMPPKKVCISWNTQDTFGSDLLTFYVTISSIICFNCIH